MCGSDLKRSERTNCRLCNTLHIISDTGVQCPFYGRFVAPMTCQAILSMSFKYNSSMRSQLRWRLCVFAVLLYHPRHQLLRKGLAPSHGLPSDIVRHKCEASFDDSYLDFVFAEIQYHLRHRPVVQRSLCGRLVHLTTCQVTSWFVRHNSMRGQLR